MKKIKMLVMDVDGTLTDGKIYQADNGEIFKAFCARDGFGIKNMLPNLNITGAVITGLITKIVPARMADLDVTEIYQGVVFQKALKLKKIAEDHNISVEEMCYVGDDVNDMDCMELAGYCACPSNAHPTVLEYMRTRKNGLITNTASGEGAVREVVDYIKDHELYNK